MGDLTLDKILKAKAILGDWENKIPEDFILNQKDIDYLSSRITLEEYLEDEEVD